MKEIEPGRKQKLDPSVRELLLGSIEFGLKMKFGNRGLRVLPEISLIQDVNLLSAILTRLKAASTLDELHPIYFQQSVQYGLVQGLLEGISLGLKLKFGSEGNSLLPEISEIRDVEQLRAILAGLETSDTLDGLRQIIQHST